MTNPNNDGWIIVKYKKEKNDKLNLKKGGSTNNRVVMEKPYIIANYQN